MKATSKTKVVIAQQHAKKKGVLRARDLAAQGIPRTYLKRLARKGTLAKIGPGLYAVPELELTEHHSLAEAAKRTPHAVICLLSALRF